MSEIEIITYEWEGDDGEQHSIEMAADEEARYAWAVPARGEGLRGSRAIPTAVAEEMIDLAARLAERDREVERLTAGLDYITECRGAFSTDPLTHARNVIEDMKAIAVGLLDGKTHEESIP